MSLNSRLLVLVDPSQDKQPALRRARFNAERRGEKPHITVFMAVDYELHKRSGLEPKLYRDPKWIDETLAGLSQAGLQHDLCISWDDEWAESVNQEIARAKSDLVLVPVYEDANGEHILSDNVWKLLRSSPVNVSLIHPRKDSTEERRVIMAAIKSQDAKFADRNKKTIEQAKALAAVYGAEVHLVNAYADQVNFPDRAKLIKETGIPNEHIHIMAGHIEEVVLTVSKKIKADLLMLAPARRKGFAGSLRGSTINKIIRNIDCDVMAIV